MIFYLKTNEMDREEAQKISKEWLGEKLTQQMSWVGNYFYGNGKYVVVGSPNSTKDDSYKDHKYLLNDWLRWSDKQDLTVNQALCIAVEMNYLTTNKKDVSSGSIDDLMCGRDNRKQKFYDGVLGLMMQNKEAN